MVVNIHAAKTHLSKLVAEVAKGKEVVIAKDGAPVARLVPIARAKATRKPGLLKGQIKIADDFDEPLPAELLATFYGGGDSR